MAAGHDTAEAAKHELEKADRQLEDAKRNFESANASSKNFNDETACRQRAMITIQTWVLLAPGGRLIPL